MTTGPLPFLNRIAFVAAAALVPVVLTAFLSIPYSLGGHPGEPRAAEVAGSGHMT